MINGDVVEQLGVEVSERYLTSAHVILLCADDLKELAPLIAELSSAPIIDVLTKSDLVSQSHVIGKETVAVSANERRGLEDLLGRIYQVLEDRYGSSSSDEPVITRARHLHAL